MCRSTWEEFEKNCEAIKAAGKILYSMQQQNMDWWPRIFWDQYCREEPGRQSQRL